MTSEDPARSVSPRESTGEREQLSASRASPPLRDFLARRYAARSPFWSWLIFERIGGALAYLFVKLRVPPAAATVMGAASGIVGALFLGAAQDVGDVVLAGVLLLTAYSLDCSDGQLARATKTASERGAWLDVTADAVVIAFVSSSLLFALLLDGDHPAVSLAVAGAFGASRTASLITSTIIRREDGGMRLTGMKDLLRTAYTAAMDTPFVYVVVSATRLTPTLLRVLMVIITLLTIGQTIVSARHHFESRGPTPV